MKYRIITNCIVNRENKIIKTYKVQGKFLFFWVDFLLHHGTYNGVNFCSIEEAQEALEMLKDDGKVVEYKQENGYGI